MTTVSKNLPLITIGILSFNRKEDLRQTLEVVTKKDIYPSKEILVLDNGSSDGSAEMVKAEFPDIILHSLAINEGAIARNFFFTAARGKYLFSFDDDSFPSESDTIFRAVEYLEQYMDFDTLSFKCIQPRTGFNETALGESHAFQQIAPGVYDGVYYIEGAMCFRTEKFQDRRGYDRDFFWGAEGLDLCLDTYKRGSRALYIPSLVCLHMRSPQNRNPKRGFYLNTRNHLWTFFKQFPFWSLLPLVPVYLIRRSVHCIKHPSLTKSFLQGIKDAFAKYQVQRKKTSKLGGGQIWRLRRWLLYLFRW